jgi:hypothetical protein
MTLRLMNGFFSRLRRIATSGMPSLTVLLTVLLTLLLPPTVRADAVDDAASRGVEFLLSVQDEKGAFRDNGAYENALTSLSALSMVALGHLPTDTDRHGTAVRKALDFLLRDSQRNRDGYFGEADNSRMYGHGITTLLLSEMLGMSADPVQAQKIRTACTEAVQLILRAQATSKTNPSFRGGWRYKPTSPDADLSISIWQLLALRSAKNAGIDVPSSAIDAAVVFLRGLYQGPKGAEGRTGFVYLPGWALSGFSASCAGMLALQICGQYDAPETGTVADWMLKHPPQAKEEPWFYYGMYYYAQGMHQRGGLHAESARKLVEEQLLPLQESDGSWKQTHDYENKRIYRTALALLCLSVKRHYLPIYQR